ncbi:hypothetical protein [Agrococcus sp. ARC_14]|uniref:hypothetical protein n=1 Tax=Agrococcus sp. ARC_14 TaxID=2919927 RepID=UPI001F06BB11|nr:hypothetical protein [Agrococcus sp. ARC_14]MCH1884322.1 hypothetical protein [Agrococcus sp. ARC_14]
MDRLHDSRGAQWALLIVGIVLTLAMVVYIAVSWPPDSSAFAIFGPLLIIFLAGSRLRALDRARDQD